MIMERNVVARSLFELLIVRYYYDGMTIALEQPGKKRKLLPDTYNNISNILLSGWEPISVQVCERGDIYCFKRIYDASK